MTKKLLDIEVIDAPKYAPPIIETWRWFAVAGLFVGIVLLDVVIWFGFMKGKENTFLTWMERLTG